MVFLNFKYKISPKLFAVSHCLFLKIIRARIPLERGARLRQIGAIGLRQALKQWICISKDEKASKK
jgi:hypothetical protein